MRNFILLTAICSLSMFGANAQLLTESFETDGEGIRYTTNTFYTACHDYFTRMDNNPGTYCLTTHPTNPNGSFYWGAEDCDVAVGGEGVLTLNAIVVTGFSLDVDILLACGRPNDGRLEAADYFIMEYNMDGGGWNQFAAFYGNNGVGVGNLQQDTDLNGFFNPGAPEITSSNFVDLNFTIPVTGNSVQVRIRTLANTGTEEIVYDNIRINGTPVSLCTDPDQPVVTATPSTICPGSSSTLTWTGNLNDATLWHIYTGSCGVTELTTTAGNSLVVSPGGTQTYYIRGEDGAGCVDESTGICGTATVTVQDITNPTITCPANQIGIVNGACNFTVPDYTGLAVVADNCTASPTVTQSPVAGTTVGTGTTNITLTATDGSSNTASCNFNVVVSDITPPTITCPGNQIGSVNGSCSYTLPDYTPLATAGDNCPGVTVSQAPAPGTIVGVGTTNIIFTATDGASNTANCNFNVVISDNTNPTITCPGNQVGSANASCNYTLPDYTPLATAADNCPGVTITQVPAPGTTVGIGTTNIVFTATDGASNTTNCNFDVVISDNTNPTITCPGDQNETVNAACQFSLPDYTGLAIAADNCGAVTVTQLPAAGTTITGATVVTLTATDGASNTASCNFNSIGTDIVAPTAVCQNINAYLDGAGNVTIVAADIDGGSTDNCGSITLAASQTAFTCADLGPNNVTLTVTDISTNSSNCVAVVTVIDTISPVTTCPGNQIENPDAACNFTLPDYTGLVTSSDNCGSTTVTQSPVAGTVISGNTTITMTSDDGNGNTSTCTFDITLNDATPPSAVCQNINVYLDGAGNATIVAADLDGGSTDNCSGLTLSASATAFTCADLGANNVTLTVTDGNSNSDNCISVVTVIDTISPVVTCPGNQIEVAGALCDFILPDYTGLITASDNCGSATVTQSPIAGTTITANTTITITADDGNGNTSTCTFDVVLDMSACAGVECSNAIALAPMDPCGDSQNVSGSTVGGTPQTEGTCGTSAGTGGASWYTFTGDGGDWTASTVNAGTNYDTKLWIFEGTCGALNCITGNDDFSGVQSQVTFATTNGLTYYVIVGGFSSSEGNYDMTITNVETEAPVADLATLTDVNGVCEIISLTAPTATDNCSAVTVTNDATLPITSNTTITWTYTDAVGNASTQTQNVILTDLVLPTASNPADSTYECIADAVIDAAVVTDEADNCSTTTVAFVSDVSDGLTCPETITRTYSVTDGSGNSIDVIHTIIIQDVTAPTASNPITLNVQCSGDVPAPVTGWVSDEADNCSTPVVAFVSDISDGLSCPETITRTFSVTDDCGNLITVEQLIVVMDIDAPVADIASLATETAYCDVTLTSPTATDNCEGTVTATTTTVFPINTLGTTTVMWTYVDACGNSSTQTQDVVIEAIEIGTWMAADSITIVASNVDAGVAYQWLDCATNQIVIGETNSNYTPTYGSDFAVIVTQNGCSDTSACVNSVVGIDEFQIENIIVYPNPTSGNIKIDLGAVYHETWIKVYNSLGQMIYNESFGSTGEVNLSIEGAPGMYILEINTEEGKSARVNLIKE